MLHDYVATLIDDRTVASKYMTIVARMEMSANTLATAVSLYRRIEGMAGRERARTLYRRRTGGSLFIKAGRDFTERAMQAGGSSREMSEHECAETTVLQGLARDPYLLLLVCSMIAAKYCRDIPYANESWATVSGIRCTTISEVERQILGILDYNLELGGERRILGEMEPHLRNEQGIAISEEARPVKIVRRLFCF
jgi:hypothetical protein